MNNITFIQSIVTELLKFADDTKCFKSIIASDIDYIKLQQDIDAPHNWLLQSQLNFNPAC